MLKSFIFEAVTKWLVGSSFFDDVKKLVKNLFNANIDGEEKRKLIRKQLYTMGYSFSNFLVNLAIESAVYILKKEKEK
jgi:hypothetical protein